MSLPDQLKSNPQNGKKLLPASTNARQEFLKTLQASIVDKTEADAERRKLYPTSSGAGLDQKAINWEVEHDREKDLMHFRIQQRGPRPNIKRECMFDVTSHGCKATKSEKQAILNISGAGKPR